MQLYLLCFCLNVDSGSNEGVCVNSDVSGYHMQRASSLSLHSSSSISNDILFSNFVEA